MDDDETSPAEAPKRQKSIGRLIALGIALVAAVAILPRLKRVDSEEKISALKKTGALVVLDVDRKHVDSLNLSILKPERLDEAIRLASGLSALNALDISGQSLSSDHIASIAKLRTLRSLALSRTGTGDRGVSELQTLHQLESLHLVGCPVTDDCLSSLARLKELKVVDLSKTQISGGLKALEKLNNLEWLLLNHNDLSGTSLETLGALPKLKRVGLKHARFDKDSLEALQSSRDITIDLDPKRAAPTANGSSRSSTNCNTRSTTRLWSTARSPKCAACSAIRSRRRPRSSTRSLRLSARLQRSCDRSRKRGLAHPPHLAQAVA